MKILTKDIVSEIREFSGEIAASVVEKRDDGLEFVEPIVVRVQANRAGDDIIVRVNAQSVFRGFCCRCLESVQRQWQEEYFFDFEMDASRDVIDVAEEIRQEIILDLPQRLLCSADCKGLCPRCGTNLNLGTCDCSSLDELPRE